MFENYDKFSHISLYPRKITSFQVSRLECTFLVLQRCISSDFHTKDSNFLFWFLIPCNFFHPV